MYNTNDVKLVYYKHIYKLLYVVSYRSTIIHNHVSEEQYELTIVSTHALDYAYSHKPNKLVITSTSQLVFQHVTESLNSVAFYHNRQKTYRFMYVHKAIVKDLQINKNCLLKLLIVLQEKLDIYNIYFFNK